MKYNIAAYFLALQGEIEAANEEELEQKLNLCVIILQPRLLLFNI